MHLDDGPAGEVLAAGRDRPVRRGRVVVAVVVVALALGLLAADRAVRDREVAALVDHVGSVAAAVAAADRRINGMQQYLRPAVSLQNVGTGPGGDLSGIEDAARAEGRREVLARLAPVEQERVLPWHGDVVDARARLAEYVAAEAARVSTTGDERVAARADAARALDRAAQGLRGLGADAAGAARLEESLGSLPGARELP